MPQRASSIRALSAMDLQILDFEKTWWRTGQFKDEQIRSIFSISTQRYYQMLNHVIDSDEAMDIEPLLVKRLRRQRSQRTAGRATVRAARH